MEHNSLTPDLNDCIIANEKEILENDNRQRSLIERLSKIKGVEIEDNVYSRITCNAEIEYDANSNEIYITSDTFIGDTHCIVEQLSDDTIVELFSKW